jgi:tetratricopeptide (TPR) repeat protein
LKAHRAISRQDFDNAEDQLQQALALNDQLPAPHNLLGVIRETRGDRLEAQNSYRAALNLDPTLRAGALQPSSICRPAPQKELRVATGAPIAGQRLAEVQMPRSGRVLSRASGEAVDEAESVFAPGEAYVVAVSEETAGEVIRLFRGSPNSGTAERRQSG